MLSEHNRDTKARWIAVFQTACEREGLTATIAAVPSGIFVHFAAQDAAPGELILHHFGLELSSAGARLEELLHPDPAITSDDSLRIENAIDTALRRIRVLLIEHNSYLSGGLPWPFPGGADILRTRGLSIYRFPKLAAVDVTAREGTIRIAFAPGELGAITSSGFYVPTRVRGDFTVTARYELPVWRPGPHTASVALFAQDEPSLHRYYSQRNSDPMSQGASHVLANLEGALLRGQPVAGSAGWFRLVRRGGSVSAWHRGTDEVEFSALGRTPDPGALPAPDMYIGAKIWSPGRCEGLVADFSELTIEAEVPSEQPPMPELRPDPRLRIRTSAKPGDSELPLG